MAPSPPRERVARLENELERARSATIVRDDALRVVLAWLANELPGCWKWVQTWVPRGYLLNPLKFPHLASLHRCNRCGLQWRQVWTPNRLRRYEGAAHAERCSRPATWQLTTTKALDGELSTWLVTVLVHASPTSYWGCIACCESVRHVSFSIELMRDSLAGGPPARCFVIYSLCLTFF